MSRRRRRSRLPEGEFKAEITGMAHDGKGVAHVDGKATFIQGALSGERVEFRYTQIKRSHAEGQITQVLKAAPERVMPRCAHYEICGGCSLQHMDPDAQILAKQQVLIDNLQQIGGVQAEQIWEPLRNQQPWGYRRKARLGVKHVPKKGKVLVGFRERAGRYIADMSHCDVLHPQIGSLLPQLSEMIAQLSIRDKLPQIEVAMSDTQCVLIFRILEPLSEQDTELLSAFCQAHEIVPYVQPGGPDTVQPLSGQAIDLHYCLPEQGVELGFLPGDFTQVNTEINRQMVSRALTLLSPQSSDQILDLFCGVGNFTLPLATQAGQVTGVEGDAGLVARARDNAARNQLSNTAFYTANLYEALDAEQWLNQQFNKALLDPPRSGAQQVLALLPKLGVETVLYISCYPGTLARDAGELVNEHGYRLLGAGVMDMFPHTAHVESIALFQRDP